MKKIIMSINLVLLLFYANIIAQAEHSAAGAEQAITQLMEGNKRYTESKTIHPNQDSKRRLETAKGQHPVAVIVTCSDSRVSPEILFDQGIGDLFVIRTAGNIVDDIGFGSIEYAVEHLGVQLVLVLGHERCGAVDATIKGGKAIGHIGYLTKAILPSVEKAKKQKGDLLDNAVIANVKNIVIKLKGSKPILKEFADEKKLTILGARYDLDDGTVTILE